MSSSWRSKQSMKGFTFLVKLVLAFSILPSAWIKIRGEHFPNVPLDSPMGKYLEALFETGFYYLFIGGIQILACILLLLPRTSVIGLIIYLPIVVNIWVLSIVLDFNSVAWLSSFLFLGSVYLLIWYYPKWRYFIED